MRRNRGAFDRLRRVASSGPAIASEQAGSLRSRRTSVPSLSGGRLQTGGIHTRFLTPVSFDPTEFAVRRPDPAAAGHHDPKITLPTAGVARIHEPEGLRARRPVA